MKNSPRRAELRLFDRACSGDIDAESLAELQELLRSKPEVAASFLDYMSMHADIYGAVRLSRVRKIVETEVGAEAAPVVPRSSIAGGWATHLSVVAALAAAVLIAIYVGRDQPTASLPDKWPDMVATVDRVEDIVWSDAGDSLEVSDAIAAGATLKFESGLLGLKLREGVSVVLEGPAHLRLEDGNRLALVEGSLAAVVPPWARGFRVDGPGVDVIDHGTKFSMSVAKGDADPEVKVLVAEGEVEVLRSGQRQDGERLFGGQGVRINEGTVEQHDVDEAASQLVAKLPDVIGGRRVEVLGDRWHDWQPGEANQPNRAGPWRYYANKDGPFGDPSSYVELRWRPSDSNSPKGSFKPNSEESGAAPDPLHVVRVHRDGGHPGRGKAQSEDGLDHYSVTAFEVPKDGTYAIESGWLERPEPRRWDLDHVLDIAVHVNDGPVVFREFCNRNCFVSFRTDLGELEAGDLIYVGVGPSGVSHNDRFRWGFYVVRELEGQQAALVSNANRESQNAAQGE